MIALWQPLPQHIRFREHTYRLLLAYDNVLAALALIADPDVLESNRELWILQLLVPDACKLPSVQRRELLQMVFRDYVFFSQRKAHGENQKVFDFDYDADLIYASFMQAYAVDLRAECGRMHWWKFYSLLQGLPDGTKLREVMNIRQRQIPEYNGKNQDEITQIMNLKQYYAIPGTSGMDDYQSGLQKLWTTLERQAKANE